MPKLMPTALVAGPTRLPLSFGLFSVVTPQPGGRWEGGGVTWETLSSGEIGGLGAFECDPDDQIGYPKDLSKLEASAGEASTFTVYGHHTCSPIGNSLSASYDSAVAHLNLREEQEVEDALWTGDLGNVPNFAGANGYPAPTTVGTFAIADAWDAVSTLEQQEAELYGSTPVFHMSRYMVTRLFNKGALSSRSGRISTPLGSPVVAGTGYGSDKIVATGQLIAYRSDIFPGSQQGFFDRSQNDLTSIAERTYLVGFDPGSLLSATITPAAT